MAYINFKEERVVALDQLQNRINNNKTRFNKIRGERVLSKIYNPDKEYSYNEFNSENFGFKKLKSELDFYEISNKDIVCSIFNKCSFHNMKFKECKFIGCYFNNCDFGDGGVVFEDCTFIKHESEELPALNINDNFSCEFYECNIYARFVNCSLSYAIFNSCNIKSTNFYLSDMASIIIINSELKKVRFSDVDLKGAKILSTYIEDLDFIDKDKSKFDEKTFFDRIKIKKGTRNEYEGVYMVYQTLADKYKENNFINNFGEYYYLCKKNQRKTLRPLPKFVSFLYYITCGYGERPMYTIYSSLVVILFFSILYLVIGIDINGEVVSYKSIFNDISLHRFLEDFNESLNLSVGMFAGVGFDNAQPLPITYMASNIEMVCGVVMMGIGISTLTKKVVR